MQPLSKQAVIAVVGGIVLVTVAVVVALWWAGTAGLNGDKLVTARLDALRTGLSIGIGGGGALALYLSWRRQRAAEITLAQAATALIQKDRDHDHAEADARERRITDLYTKAVEQLGSDKAPVRLGGLYALERLAQDNPLQRQTIVNVLCAYLRMPYTLPGLKPTDDTEVVYLERVQEREVRLTAQRILAHHLRPGGNTESPVATFWPDIELDLNNATLIDFAFYHVAVRAVSFRGAKFCGYASFGGAQFDDDADFEEAQFRDDVQFDDAQFDGHTVFVGATFAGVAGFSSSRFSGSVQFGMAQFGGVAWFSYVRFGTDASFYETVFRGDVLFDNAQFSTLGGFYENRFDGAVEFTNVTFSGDVPEGLEQYLEAVGECNP